MQLFRRNKQEEEVFEHQYERTPEQRKYCIRSHEALTDQQVDEIIRWCDYTLRTEPLDSMKLSVMHARLDVIYKNGVGVKFSEQYGPKCITITIFWDSRMETDVLSVSFVFNNTEEIPLQK